VEKWTFYFLIGDGELESTPKGRVSAVVCLMALDFISEERMMQTTFLLGNV